MTLHEMMTGWYSYLQQLPNLILALLVLLIGWLIAKIIRDILTGFLNSIGIEKFSQRLGLGKTAEGAGIFIVIGNIAFILILLPTIITALEKLDLKGISDQAIAMLQKMVTLLPNITVAVCLIFGGVWLGNWIEKVVAQMLWRLRFDYLLHHMGIGSLSSEQSKYSFSQLAGLLVKIVVILLFTVEALQVVELKFLVTLATGVIAYLPMVFAALVILGIGLYLGHLVESILLNVLTRSNSRTLASVAKYAIFVISVFMALDEMGIAKSIVNAAFILVLGGLTLAFDLAFGFGGKDFASKYLQRLDRKIDQNKRI